MENRSKSGKIQQGTYRYVSLLAICMSIACMWASCRSEMMETPTPPGECMTDNVTFSGTVVPILQNNCVECHNTALQNGGIILQGHSNVLAAVQSGRLWGAITHSAGFVPMPEGRPKLNDCFIEQIGVWIGAGAPNN